MRRTVLNFGAFDLTLESSPPSAKTAVLVSFVATFGRLASFLTDLYPTLVYITCCSDAMTSNP